MAGTRADARNRRRVRGRKNLRGTAERPRLAIYRSNKYIYAQVIDDAVGRTLAAASSREKDLAAPEEGGGKTGIAHSVGLALADRAKAAGVEAVVFDRRFYKYHGRVKALAEGARKGGLKF